jgi:hypothetical protein
LRVAAAGDRAGIPFFDFFTANIRNLRRDRNRLLLERRASHDCEIVRNGDPGVNDA